MTEEPWGIHFIPRGSRDLNRLDQHTLIPEWLRKFFRRKDAPAAIARREHPASYLTLDDEGTRRSALEDPTGFIAAISGPAVIDEVQRAPELMLAIKVRLDTNNDRGQFLLTGSANVTTLTSITDALPGRVEYIRLWPFSHGLPPSGRRSAKLEDGRGAKLEPSPKLAPRRGQSAAAPGGEGTMAGEGGVLTPLGQWFPSDAAERGQGGAQA